MVCGIITLTHFNRIVEDTDCTGGSVARRVPRVPSDCHRTTCCLRQLSDFRTFLEGSNFDLYFASHMNEAPQKLSFAQAAQATVALPQRIGFVRSDLSVTGASMADIHLLDCRPGSTHKRQSHTRSCVWSVSVVIISVIPPFSHRFAFSASLLIIRLNNNLLL